MSLGDQKPSQLLAEMRRLGGSTVSDDFMKTLWLKILPQQVRAILSTNDVDLPRLATLADTILEVSQCSSVQSVERSFSPAAHEASTLERQIAQLTRAVERLTTASRFDNSSEVSSKQRSRSQTRGRAQQRRGTTPANNDHQHEFCWYHFKFGNAATKCKEPCNFKPPKN